MQPTRNNPWRRIRTPLLLYILLAIFLLWLLPPPIHFQFTSDNAGRLFKPTTEHALVRIHTENKNPTSINDYFIERIDLHTGQTKRIPLDSSDKKLSTVKFYICSLNGSTILIIHNGNNWEFSVWDGQSGQLRFNRMGHVLGGQEAAFSPDGSRIAMKTMYGGVDIIDSQSGKALGLLPMIHFPDPVDFNRLLFSLEGTCLARNYKNPTLPYENVTGLFSDKQSKAIFHLEGEPDIIPAPHGFWLMQWNRSQEKITLSYLDGATGKLTTLAPELSRRLDGFPHIFSDTAGHLYLLQSCKPDTTSWQHRTRQTILTWLNKLGFNWETTDTIQIRQISPDGKRILREQTFAANYAEISPDGNYLILMSQMKNESKYFIYRYPTQLNWVHALSWPAIPTLLLVFLRRRQNTSPLPTGERVQG